ncbi:integrase/recombinase XerD [Clostridiales Family XIII bacterium PM5-7]
MGINEFLIYLKEEKKTKPNTIEAYRRDLVAFDLFLSGRNIFGLNQASNTDVVAYLMELKSTGKSKSTINRKLASIRSFYKFLLHHELIKVNPSDDIKSPRIQRKELEYLTVEEVDKLLSMPDESIKGIRDKALLEMLYATGLRVTEIIALNYEDVNLRMGFITCNGEHGKARIVPMGTLARQALDKYLMSSRNVLMREQNLDDEKGKLFVNFMGEPLTRQGLWKILREYGNKADLNGKLTPQILRNSFGVHMVQNGADLKSLQELMGLEDIAATEIYLSVSKNRIKDVYDKTHPRA